MDENNNLVSGIWYGPILDNESITTIKDNFASITSEQECILSIMEILKSGDFTIKNMLIDLMNSTRDEEGLNLCIRLFCSVATHEDFLIDNNMVFLSTLSDSNANTFAACAPTALSYNVVPYLLALLEEWEDIYVEQTIRDALDTILAYTELLPEDASINQIGEFYLEKIKGVEPDYYYAGQPVFPGNEAKQLINQAFLSLKNATKLKMSIVPSLLSIWSGIKCPVDYQTEMNQDSLNSVTSYVNELSKKNWEVGAKYFYGHEIK